MAMSIPLKLKWNKLSFSLEFDVSTGDVSTLKAIIFGLTGVPADRQKLMAKGAWTGTLKDDADLSKVSLKADQLITLMGTADVVVAPQEEIKFVEDMSETQKAGLGLVQSAGLENVGNTCYMNSTVQCLRHMSELRGAMAPIGSIDNNPLITLACALKSTFDGLDNSGSSVVPFALVSQLRRTFPQFGERSPQGQFMQQDAEEFYDAISQSLKQAIKQSNGDYESVMGIELDEVLECSETSIEPPVVKKESTNKIVCNIQGTEAGAIASVDHLRDGVKLWMEGVVEKQSSVLGRNALWKKKVRISKLPQYVCIQFMRFFWKATPESSDHQGVKCKIMRPVTFPDTLDMYEFCSESLQTQLRLNREIEDKALQANLAKANTKADEVVAPSEGDVPMEVDSDEASALQAALAMSMVAPETVFNATTSGFGAGIPTDFTGLYELHSIVSHKGRSADAGHYMGWVRQAPASDTWWKYDDSKVTEVTSNDVMMLKGGADRDTAYLMFYRFKGNRK